jgi:hypothetical protein
MRILFLAAWLMLPVAALAYHYGPGQRQQSLDQTSKILKMAEASLAAEDPADAIEMFDAALSKLPEDRVAEKRKIRLERAKAQMLAQQLPQAHDDLKALVDELMADKKSDPKVLEEARSALANASYYVTWILRLEGVAQDDWEPEIETSRQGYKLLAEEAAARGDSEKAEQYRKDLEASIRLARMDLEELQGLGLPKQCKGCCSCKGKNRNKVTMKKEDGRGAGGGADIPTAGH